MTLPPQTLPAGDTTRIDLQPPVQLGNKGGLITLVNTDGLKVDGVAYTQDQADREGLDHHLLSPKIHRRRIDWSAPVNLRLALDVQCIRVNAEAYHPDLRKTRSRTWFITLKERC